MLGRRAVLAFVLMSLFLVAPAGAAPPDPVDDANGAEWRQLYETTGLTWSQVAEVCPRDGMTECSGSLAGWVWATDAQVVALMGRYAPEILTASPPSVGGPDYFTIAAGFLTDMRWTAYISLYGAYSEWTDGWTSSTDEAGLPISGRVAYGWWPPAGSFSVLGRADQADYSRGVFLWRPAGQDHTGPVITPTVEGTAGNADWYVSDVSVTWDVQDAESPVTSQSGCDTATVTSDTAGTAFTCEATSAGGTSSASALVKRDTTPPSVSCGSPAPVFQIYQVGAWVPATVTDETSRPAMATVQGATKTGAAGSFTTTVTGADQAGNRTTISCPYQVAIPTCRGLTPTRVGTASNDIINGTSGRDVIVGLGGADTIYGNGGDDVICGGDGPDNLEGGEGNDWIDGGASSDSIRGGGGVDTCISGEARMSSCEL